MFWSFGHKACEILAPQPGIKLAPPALEDEVLTTGPPGKPLIYIVDSLILKSGATILQFIPEGILSNTCIFSIRHITEFFHLGMLDSTSALFWGALKKGTIM